MKLSNTWYEGWIPCGLMYDVGDTGENTAFTLVNDGANTYGTGLIYQALIHDAHLTVNGFVNTLLNRSVFAQETQVRSLQQQYGY